MKALSLVVVALFAQSSFAGEVCLRADKIDQIRMTGDATAIATDRNGHVFDLTFVAACGARQPNAFFIIKPEFLPACIAKGVALPTHKQGPCVVKTAKARA